MSTPSMFSAWWQYWRRTLMLYETLPVQNIPANLVHPDHSHETLTDALMPLTPESAQASMADIKFGPDFMFGSATAAYQVEGGLHNCNWSEWEDQGTRPHDGHVTVEHNDKAGRACDSWHRFFQQDVPCLQAINARMYRFSVEWSRIEPEEGEFDEAVLARYQSWCEHLRAHHIEPMITLHHFTEPSWFGKQGGWEERRNVDVYWKRFCDTVTTRLAPHCRYWTTMNELNGYVICGWMVGVHPPGKHNALGTMLKVQRHLLVAHTIASKSIRAASATVSDSPIICMALNHVLFLPQEPPHPAEQANHAAAWGVLATVGHVFNRVLSHIVALFLNYYYNWIILDAMFSPKHAGRTCWFPIPFQLPLVLFGWAKDIRALKDSADWIGINHYYRSYVHFELAGSPLAQAEDEQEQEQHASPTDMFIRLPFPRGAQLRATAVPEFEKNEMGWDLTPSSMQRLVEMIADRYPGVPMIITESGTADQTDRKRVRYLAGMLKGLHELMQRNKAVDLRGYLVWSLLDNFEWAEGFRCRFGIFETDFETFERKERKPTCELLRSVFPPPQPNVGKDNREI